MAIMLGFDDLYVTHVCNVCNILNATLLNHYKLFLCRTSHGVSNIDPACMFSTIVSFSVPLTCINSTLVADTIIGPTASSSLVSLIPNAQEFYFFIGLLLSFSFCLSG